MKICTYRTDGSNRSCRQLHWQFVPSCFSRWDLRRRRARGDRTIRFVALPLTLEPFRLLPPHWDSPETEPLASHHLQNNSRMNEMSRNLMPAHISLTSRLLQMLDSYFDHVFGAMNRTPMALTNQKRVKSYWRQ